MIYRRGGDVDTVVAELEHAPARMGRRPTMRRIAQRERTLQGIDRL
jgi:hypothetical protein